jgi:periplasmic mercuric ion binding protein
MFMKTLLFSVVTALALAASARADVTVTLTKTHMCCDKCVNAAQKTVSMVDGCTGVADKAAHTVVITAPDGATAQKAVDALVKAGFYGEMKEDTTKVIADAGTKGEKVQKLTIKNVHLCCPKCVKVAHEALATVPGVTGDTATKGAESFDVTGDFTDTDAIKALQKAGLTGKVGGE